MAFDACGSGLPDYPRRCFSTRMTSIASKDAPGAALFDLVGIDSEFPQTCRETFGASDFVFSASGFVFSASGCFVHHGTQTRDPLLAVQKRGIAIVKTQPPAFDRQLQTENLRTPAATLRHHGHIGA